MGSTLSGAGLAQIEGILEESRTLGFLGPGPIGQHVSHSLAFAQLVPDEPGLAVDLGSGGGIPGLPLALLWPATRWVLLDANVRRTTWLESKVEELGLADRIRVQCQRAEEAGRGELRGTVDLVVARSFASPAVTAECSAPLLRVGGLAVVAEPPGGDSHRWPRDGLAEVGLEPADTIVQPVALQLLRQVQPCGERFPRRVGIPAKRPLFS